MAKYLTTLLVLLCLAPLGHAQSPWPGQVGNTVGYASFGDGVLGTATGCTITSGTVAAPTIISKCKFTLPLTISQHDIIFEQDDFQGAASASSGLVITGQRITFLGSRIGVNNTGGPGTSGANTQIQGGTTIAFIKTTFAPPNSLYTAPPGAAWPSAGAGQNTTTQTTNVNAIDGNSGYEYGVNLLSGGPVWMDHCDMWGFGNAVVIYTSTGTTITNSWIHDDANASPQGYHTDGPGYLNGGAGPNNVTLMGSTIGFIGNTNAVAFQAATSGYSHMFEDYNYLTGDGYTDSPGEPGSTHYSNSTHTFDVFGTDVEPVWNPLYNNTFPSSGNTVWACNKFKYLVGTTWTDGDAWTPPSSIDGKYWLPQNPLSGGVSTTDNGGNTICNQLAPSSLDFDVQGTNITSAKKTVSLTSTNTGTVNISAISLAAGNSFALAAATSNPCPAVPFSLTSGSTCNIAVTFTPTAQGLQTDQINITSNQPTPANAQFVPLIGVGTPGNAGGPPAPPTGFAVVVH